MKEILGMAVVQALEELLHKASDLLVVEHKETGVEQAEEVVVHVLENEIELAAVLAELERVLFVRHDLDHVHDVRVLQLSQDLDLAHCRYREALFLVL